MLRSQNASDRPVHTPPESIEGVIILPENGSQMVRITSGEHFGEKARVSPPMDIQIGTVVKFILIPKPDDLVAVGVTTK